jgi:hypothetical protein
MWITYPFVSAHNAEMRLDSGATVGIGVFLRTQRLSLGCPTGSPGAKPGTSSPRFAPPVPRPSGASRPVREREVVNGPHVIEEF